MILPATPTWPQLTSLLPSAVPESTGLTLHRERNGWCVHSAQIWLALEVKGVPFATVQEIGTSAPALHWPDATVQTDSVEVLRALDAALPSTTPLWPPAGVEACVVSEMVGAFAATMPAARESARAAYLFCAEEGSLYDPLPRATFVATLDATEELLGRHGGGPFFCGGRFSAADVVWAPLLERYAAQLPCLHDGLRPRGGEWPRLTRWYEAMDKVPAWACRVRGDAASWRKVLSSSPWWPAGWPPRGGPAERGTPQQSFVVKRLSGPSSGPFGGALALTAPEASAASGEVVAPQRLWTAYAETRPGVARTPAAEAAATIVRNAAALARDALVRTTPVIGSEAEADAALRHVAALLLLRTPHNDEAETAGMNAAPPASTDPRIQAQVSPCSAAPPTAHVDALLAYLDDRLCVPRDMGAPAAAALRALPRARRQHGDSAPPNLASGLRAGEPGVRVNRF